MKARKGQTITSKNLDPAESWKVTYVDSEAVVVKAKSDPAFMLTVKHGQYNINS